jgi:hypothetical protein
MQVLEKRTALNVFSAKRMNEVRFFNFDKQQILLAFSYIGELIEFKNNKIVWKHILDTSIIDVFGEYIKATSKLIPQIIIR